MSRTFKDVPFYVRTRRGAGEPKRRERYDNILFGDGTTKSRRQKNHVIDHDHENMGRIITRRRYFYDENGDSIVYVFTHKQKAEAEALCRKFDNDGVEYRTAERDAFSSWSFEYLGGHRPIMRRRGDTFVDVSAFKVMPFELVEVDAYADHCTAQEELVDSAFSRYSKGSYRTLDGLLAPCSPEFVYSNNRYRDSYENHGDHAHAHNRSNRTRATALARKAVTSYAVDGDIPEEHYDGMTYDLPNGWCC